MEISKKRKQEAIDKNYLPLSKSAKTEERVSLEELRAAKLPRLGKELFVLMQPKGDFLFGSGVQSAFSNIQITGEACELNFEHVYDDSLAQLEPQQWQRLNETLNSLGFKEVKVQLPASWETLADTKASYWEGLKALDRLRTVVVDVSGGRDAKGLDLTALREGLNIEVSFAGVREGTVGGWIPDVPHGLRPQKEALLPYSPGEPQTHLGTDDRQSAGSPPLKAELEAGSPQQTATLHSLAPEDTGDTPVPNDPSPPQRLDGISTIAPDELWEDYGGAGDSGEGTGEAGAGDSPDLPLADDLQARRMAHSQTEGFFALQAAGTGLPPGESKRGSDMDSPSNINLPDLPVVEGSWTFTVPPGSKVYATGFRTEGVSTVEKSSVVYGNGPDAPVLPLGGLVYWRGSAAGTETKGVGALMALEQHPLGLNLNEQVALSSNPTEPIACKYLALQWIFDRIDHHAAQSMTTEKLRFSYGHYGSAQTLKAHVKPDIDTRVESLEAGRRSPVDVQSFGDMLSDQFQQMKAGDNRYFLLGSEYANTAGQNNGSSGHMLALELRYKPAEGTRPAHYVVNLYDPNHTQTHQRIFSLDPAQLQNKSIAHWLDEVRLDSYFPEEGGKGLRSIGTLYRVDPPTAGGVPADPSSDTKQNPQQDTKQLVIPQAAPTQEPPFGSKAYVRSQDQLLANIKNVHFSTEPGLLDDVISWVAGAPGLDSAGRSRLLGDGKFITNVEDAGLQQVFVAGIRQLPDDVLNQADKATLASLFEQ